MSYGSGGNFNQGGGQQGNPYGAPQTPGYGPGPMPPGSVKNYLVESIILLLCCGGVLAIPAVVYAAQVNGKLQQGDYQGAVAASENAKKWCLIAIGIQLVCGLGSLVLYGLMVAFVGVQQ